LHYFKSTTIILISSNH